MDIIEDHVKKNEPIDFYRYRLTTKFIVTIHVSVIITDVATMGPQT